MEQYNLFLDDIRTPKDVFNYTNDIDYIDKNWVCVKSTKDFMDTINKLGMPSMISFDHDLGYQDDGAKTARTFIEWCMANDIPITAKIIIHSQNPVGKERISSIFKSYFKVLNLIISSL